MFTWSKIIKQELQFLDPTESRSSNIMKLRETLRTILPISVEAEREFSVVGILITIKR